MKKGRKIWNYYKVWNRDEVNQIEKLLEQLLCFVARFKSIKYTQAHRRQYWVNAIALEALVDGKLKKGRKNWDFYKVWNRDEVNQIEKLLQ